MIEHARKPAVFPTKVMKMLIIHSTLPPRTNSMRTLTNAQKLKTLTDVPNYMNGIWMTLSHV